MHPDRIVAIASHPNPCSYPNKVPFHPHEIYPEFRGKVKVSERGNITFILFRKLLFDLGMDMENFSTPDWNPFREIINPGEKVLIKPNLVRHLHLGGGDYQAVVTHASVIRCVLDYVALALNGKGDIVVGDAPIQSADFSKILERTGLQEVCDDITKTWQIPVRLVDFRLWSVNLDGSHQVIEGRDLQGDPAGYITVNLGKRSLLTPLNKQSDRFRVTSYDCGDMVKHHNEKRHEYLIPRTVLDADVVINLPKLKTHRKVGLTAALKNLVGINGLKDWLPHHRHGSVKEGGDEYQYASLLKRLQNRIAEKIDKYPQSRLNSLRRLGIRAAGRLSRSVGRDHFEEGSWYGNDTIWRTVLDLNRLLVYADREGKMTKCPQRRCLTIVDAIIAGEGEGPMEPDVRACGLLLAGCNPVAVDAVLATMIGFDFRKIPLIARCFEIKNWPITSFDPEQIEVFSQDDQWKSITVGKPCGELCFKPSSGWLGHIESDICRGK